MIGLQDGPLAAPTLAEIERALDEAVSALVAYRREPPSAVKRALDGRPEGFEVLGIRALTETDQGVMSARDMAKSPVEQGLKYSIKKLGQLVHQLVGDAGMLDVAERVCALDDDNWGRRMSPIDSAWNGIGSWYS